MGRGWRLDVVLLVLLFGVGALGQQCVEKLTDENCAEQCVPESSNSGDAFQCVDWFTKQTCCRTAEVEELPGGSEFNVCVCLDEGLTPGGIGVVTASVLVSVLTILCCFLYFKRIAKKDKMRDCEYNKSAIEATKNYLPR